MQVHLNHKRILLRLITFHRLAEAEEEEESVTHLKTIFFQVPREVNSCIIAITPYYEIGSESILYKIKFNFLKPVYLIL